MAIFQKNDGGVMDVIRCDEQDYLIWKWHPQGTSSETSQRANAIRWGSSLRVRDGSVAVFVYNQNDGTIQDYIEGPFDEMIDTKNFPVLASLIGVLYKGGSPFQAEIYFINLANLIQIKFGVPYFDVFDPRFMDLGVPTAVRGSINFRIADYREFIRLHRLDEFELSTFKNQIKNSVIRIVKSVVSNAPNEHGIPVVQMERQISEINALIEAEISNKLRAEYGVSVSSVDVSDIEINKNSEGYKKLQAATQNKGTSFIQGAAGLVDAIGIQRHGAKVIKNTLKGEDGKKGLNIGDVGQKIGSMIEGIKASKPSPPPIPTNGFFVAIDGKQKGPYDISKLRQMKDKGTIDGDSLVWKEGMENWTRAEDIKDLKALFPDAPPIPDTDR